MQPPGYVKSYSVTFNALMHMPLIFFLKEHLDIHIKHEGSIKQNAQRSQGVQKGKQLNLKTKDIIRFMKIEKNVALHIAIPSAWSLA